VLIMLMSIAAVCFAVEHAVPGWRLPRVRTWPLRIVLVNAVQVAVVLLAGVTWEKWLSATSLLHLSKWVPALTGGVIAYFVATFVFYWWHRWRHEHNFLWRGFHQIHHSPQRLEVITSFYKHPGEMIVNSIIGSLLVYSLLGLSLQAGAWYTFCTAVGEFFYHTNIKTPRWVGFFFQRPEMHRIHHQYGRHKNNYGDITWWDMMFGTYENPKEWASTCGFDGAKEQQLLRMLAYQDVHAEARPTAATARLDR
jgi:sterol desaturase/sphingolipid hydroxylase (fatty acid hydroxylase superfamily)